MCSEIPAFRPKPSWLPPTGDASLEIFLSLLEKELLTDDLDEPWDRADYILEAVKHPNDKRIYKEVKIIENIPTGLFEKSNEIFNRFCSHTYNFDKANNLQKLYILPKIHKRFC